MYLKANVDQADLPDHGFFHKMLEMLTQVRAQIRGVLDDISEMIFFICPYKYTVELQWLKHLRDHENQFETGVVRTNDGRL